MSSDKDLQAKILAAAFQQADNGGFVKATKLLKSSGQFDPLAVQFFGSLDQLLVNEPDSSAMWRETMARIAACHNAIKLGGTFDKADAISSEGFRENFTEAGPGLKYSPRSISLITMGDHRLTLRSDFEMKPCNTIIINALLHFPTNVMDHFYLRAEGVSRVDALRFSNSGVSYGSDESIYPCDTSSPKLYTMVISRESVSVFINGILRIRRDYKTGRNEHPGDIKNVALELIGEPGVDLEGLALGIEVWGCDKQVESFFGESHSLHNLLLSADLENMNVDGVYDTVTLIEGIATDDYENRLVALLDEQVGKTPFNDWICKALLGCLTGTRAEKWNEENAHKIPDPVISVENVSIRFSRTPQKALSIARLFKKIDMDMFHALTKVDLKVYQGDIIGIIGANGAGKSTLLKAMAGLVPIKTGRIYLEGDHLLLSSGLGIRDEMTGRENIYLGGCYMQLTPKEIDELYDDIVSFSELGEAIDRPFKYYSDGMKTRLTFSLATSLSPDILMLDELLNAGDVKFQKKAAERLRNLITRSRVVVVVTHSIHFVREYCTKALYIRDGEAIFSGSPQAAVTKYLNDLHLPAEKPGKDGGLEKALSKEESLFTP